MVPQTVAKMAICDYQVASGDCLVALIAKLANVGGVSLVGNGRLVEGMLLVRLYYIGTTPNPRLLTPTTVMLQTQPLVCIAACIP